MNRIFVPTEHELNSLGKIPAVVTGMGKLDMTHTLYRIGRNPEDIFWLVGFCGLLKGDYKLGDRVEPSCVIDGDYNAYPIEDSIHFIELKPKPSIACISVERILTNNPFEDICASFKSVICDMETFAFVDFCIRNKVSYRIVRIVSDIVGLDSAEDFRRMCKTNALEEVMERELNG